MPAASLGKRILKARNEINMDQETLADKVGVSRTQIINIEYDRSSTSIETLKRICRTLKVSSDYLLGLKIKTKH